jgi:hypothetical protein
MRIYTVFLRKTADPLFTPDLGAVFVREGFNWAAILVAGDVAIALIHEAIDLDSASQLWTTLAWHIVVGFIAEDLRRWSLHLSGYALAEIVAAEGLAAAERRFFEHHPAMAQPAWR